MNQQNSAHGKPDILLESFTQEDFETAHKNLLTHFRFWQGLLISNDEKSIITPDDLGAFQLQASEISEQEIKSAQEIEQLKILTVLIYLLTSADTRAAYTNTPESADSPQYLLINSYIVRKILHQSDDMDMGTMQKLLAFQNQICAEQEQSPSPPSQRPQILAQNLRCSSGEQFSLKNLANKLYLEIAAEQTATATTAPHTIVDPERTEPIEPLQIESSTNTADTNPAPDLESQVLLGEGAKYLKDVPYRNQLACGVELCAATYIGVNREQNEDAIIISPLYNQLSVIDAMGGYGNGSIAREVFIQNVLQNPNNIETAVLNAQKQYDQCKLQYGGVCLTHLQVIKSEPEGYTLHLSQAGDVHTTLFDPEGNLRYESKDESIGHRVFNAIISKSATDMQRANGWSKFGTLTRTRISVGPGWRIAIYSDGISNHLTAETLKPLIIGNTLEEALHNVSSSIDSAMHENESYQDNCSLALLEF